MTTHQTAALREYLLTRGGDHLDFDMAIAGLPTELRDAGRCD